MLYRNKHPYLVAYNIQMQKAGAWLESYAEIPARF